MSEIKLSRQKLKKKKRMPWWSWLLLVFFSLIVIAVSALAVVANSSKKVVQAFQLQAMETAYLAKEAYDLFKTQNLPATKEKIAQTQASFEKTKAAYSTLESPLNLLGYKQYYQDGFELIAAAEIGLELGNKVIDIIEPYADMLGFEAKSEEEEAGGTAEDRVKKLLDTLSVVGPQLDVVMTDLEAIQTHINKIEAKNYPEKVGDLFGAKFVLQRLNKAELIEQPVASEIVKVQSGIDLAINTFAEYRPVIDKLPEMMGGGLDSRKKYLVLFQNNNELRPTGGFLTAYSIIFIEDGKVTPEKSDDIYELDKKFNKKIAIPKELGKYLTTEKYWHLRDMNIDPDFKNSMDVFLENYKEVKGEPQDIDGIIALDTRVLTDLIDLLGPIKVEGYGEFSTEADKKYNAPQIVIALSEIITRPTPYIREDRKGILGPMMKALLEKTYGASKEQFPALFQLMLNNIQGRHLQVYFLDEEMQLAAEKINIAGRMLPPTDGSDFLAIVDANLGGAKSNLFIDYSVEQTILTPDNGLLEKRVVINYTNSQAGDDCNLERGLLCLNSVNNDWNRIYLPLGSKLVSAKGYLGEPVVYEENGFTVIDGFFKLNPKNNAKIDLEYTVPYANTENYQLKIWQQGGLRDTKHLIDVNDNQEEIIVNRDTLYQASF